MVCRYVAAVRPAVRAAPRLRLLVVAGSGRGGEPARLLAQVRLPPHAGGQLAGVGGLPLHRTVECQGHRQDLVTLIKMT